MKLPLLARETQKRNDIKIIIKLKTAQNFTTENHCIRIEGKNAPKWQKSLDFP